MKFVFLVRNVNLPKFIFGRDYFLAFCFLSKNEFKKYIQTKYKNFWRKIFNNIKFIRKVPNYTPCGRVFMFETLDQFKKPVLYECLKNGLGLVMMAWEKSYMEHCVDFLEPEGHVLEFGFGLGYSASQFLKHNIKSYTVVEKSPEVYEKAIRWSKQNKNKSIKIKVVLSDWKDYIPNIKFNVFFFDTFEKNYSDNLLNLFAEKYSYDNSKFGGYNVGDSIRSFKGKFVLKEFKEFKTIIPTNAKYIFKSSKLFLICYEKQKNLLCY